MLGTASGGKLTKAMLEVLSQLPPGVTPSKEVVVQHLGMLGQMSKTRDVNAAWNSAQRQVVREHPGRFYLDGKVLRSASAMKDRPVVASGEAIRPFPIHVEPRAAGDHHVEPVPEDVPESLCSSS